MIKTLFTILAISICHLALADICFTTFEEDSTNADVIFVGKIIDVNYGAYWDGGVPASIYTFEILESFKGLTEWRTVTSIISPIGGCCSPHFKMDSTFLVFAFSDGDYPNIYWTNDCTLTGLLSNEYTKEYYARLGESLKPEKRSRDLEMYKERKAWLMKPEQEKMDSINLAFANLKSDLDDKQRTNNYLITLLAILILSTFWLALQKFRSKHST